jgi:FdhD protein
MLEVEIVRVDVSSGKSDSMLDCVAQEKPFYIFLHRSLNVTIFCTPSNLGELAIGHLLTEGVVRSIEEIEEINLKEEGVCKVILKENIDLQERLRLSRRFSRVIFSACGSRGPYRPSMRLPKIKSDLRVKAETVLNCVNRLNSEAELFRKTGGVHTAAIYKSNGVVMAFAEDVGRHNAVDKVIGMAASKKVDLSACFLALSGRLTGDIIFKAARVGLPMVASLAAAIDSGVAIAKGVNLTLVGFARGKRMNIYSYPERISL